MSGHSKWSTIKRAKGAADAKRGKIFTKLLREIVVATKIGGAILETNGRLKTAIEKAKAANMPKDTIERAIKKASGEGSTENYTDMLYEGYGPGGVAIMIEALTDNKNRTAGEVRNILSKRSGNLGESGCVSYLFSRKGIIIFDAKKYKEEELTDVVIELGADDISSTMEQDGSGIIEVVCEFAQFLEISDKLKEKGYTPESAEVMYLPATTISLDKEMAEKVLSLIDTLEDNDDVQNVYTNLNFDNIEA